MRGFATPGSAGNFSFATVTRLPSESRGTCEAGGSTPRVTQSVIATSSARIVHQYSSGFGACWPAVSGGAGNGAGPCWVPVRK